uniref:Uncharacterized protein n=1 Tax=Steinernema glaseri TaxID=37863 RepID=A0A1I7ZJ77_9BILA
MDSVPFAFCSAVFELLLNSERTEELLDTMVYPEGSAVWKAAAVEQLKINRSIQARKRDEEFRSFLEWWFVEANNMG